MIRGLIISGSSVGNRAQLLQGRMGFAGGGDFLGPSAIRRERTRVTAIRNLKLALRLDLVLPRYVIVRRRCCCGRPWPYELRPSLLRRVFQGCGWARRSSRCTSRCRSYAAHVRSRVGSKLTKRARRICRFQRYAELYRIAKKPGGENVVNKDKLAAQNEVMEAMLKPGQVN